MAYTSQNSNLFTHTSHSIANSLRYRILFASNFLFVCVTDVRKWLRQQSKDFYAAGFEALVKRWDKCISVGGGYVEKYIFFQV
jgi:hypothetical protein